MASQLRFLFALWQANLQSAMEFRAAFLTQVIGMMLNNGVYFLFWVIFFNRFQQVGGWGLNDMFVLFGIAACAFGVSVYLFGNVLYLSDIIAKGQLDYYLSLPRPALLHALASRSVQSGAGDAIYGLLSFLVAGQFHLDALLRFFLGVILAVTIFVSFLTLVNSLAFWLGNAQMIASQATNAMITFAIYPISLFDGSGKFLLFTLLPAAFLGAVPAEFVRAFTWQGLAQLTLAAFGLLALAIFTFQRGLRRYESGSAIHIQA